MTVKPKINFNYGNTVGSLSLYGTTNFLVKVKNLIWYNPVTTESERRDSLNYILKNKYDFKL